MPHQISVFLENKPGKLEKVTNLLAGAGINIRAITIAGSGDSGVLKLLVNDPGKAYDILTGNGLVAARKEVVAVKTPDQPGGLDRVARILTREGINIDDAYGFVLESGKNAVLVIQIADPEKTARVLEREGLDLIGEEDLYSL
jgi:hypothetical protein